MKSPYNLPRSQSPHTHASAPGSPTRPHPHTSQHNQATTPPPPKMSGQRGVKPDLPPPLHLPPQDGNMTGQHSRPKVFVRRHMVLWMSKGLGVRVSQTVSGMGVHDADGFSSNKMAERFFPTRWPAVWKGGGAGGPTSHLCAGLAFERSHAVHTRVLTLKRLRLFLTIC